VICVLFFCFSIWHALDDLSVCMCSIGGVFWFLVDWVGCLLWVCVVFFFVWISFISLSTEMMIT